MPSESTKLSQCMFMSNILKIQVKIADVFKLLDLLNSVIIGVPQALLAWIQFTLQNINLTVLNFLGVLIEDAGN